VNLREYAMNVKLTLNLNKDIIEQAKLYARDKNQSLSSLVQNYFIFLAEKNPVDEIEISPIVKELTGIISLDKDFDIREEYGSYIQEKYT
jgi:hypothetical protein